ncbi:MAG: TolC family protein [Planctomycetota bacterium]
MVALLAGAVGTSGCRVPGREVENADREVYGVLEKATEKVTGMAKTEPVERPADTLRQRLLAGAATAGDSLTLRLTECLDIAAENSRDFQRQRELLYLTALALTRAVNDVSWLFGGGGTATANGVGDDSSAVSLSDDLRASQNTLAGPRIVASFVNNFLRSLTSGGGWDASSILGLTLTQPLLRGVSPNIIREPLNQAERDVIYQVRDYERFRSTFAVRVVSDYYRLLEQTQNLGAEAANRASLTRSRERIEAMAEAGRNTATDVGRARQNEYNAQNREIDARVRLEASVDRFLLTLGLPVDAPAQVDVTELERLQAMPVEDVDIDEETAIATALARRVDYRNTRDEVEDAVRRINVARDALRSQLDFSAVVNVPTEPDKPFKLDWSRVQWRAGFDLELALNKLPERNAYRTSLINLDVFIRAREQFEDQIKTDVREALRTLRRAVKSYEIQTRAVELAEERVQSTRDFFEAGDRGVTTLDVLDAQESLLNAQLAQMSARVSYAIARLQLLLTLDGLVLEPKGLRFDPALPLPSAPTTAAVDLPAGSAGLHAQPPVTRP